MPAPARSCPRAICTDVAPGPIFIGVEKPMKVYSFDNVLITHAKVPDELVYKILDTMEKNKADLVAVQPVLREFSAGVRLQEMRRALPSRRAEILQGTRPRSRGR